MQNFWKVIFVFTSVLFILACSLTASPSIVSQTPIITPPENTPLSAPTNSPLTLPTNTVVPEGLQVTFANVSLMIPTDLAYGATGEQVAEVNANNGAPWEVAPAHLKLTLNGYPLPGTMWKPVLTSYPAVQFSTMDDGAAQTITSLKSVISSPPSLPNHLPFLPLINASQVFYARAQILQFKNGTGISYITQFDQAPLPINNQELFYTFQGLTNDGNYYISLTLPIHSPLLPADDNPNSPVPSGGVAFDQNDFSKFTKYLSDVTNLLNSASPDSFSPPLPTMDKLVKSISVTP
jgi:hypothetical protein